jgi:dipeptidyl aminopeptidase/acylaminoacyl peptidase
MTISRRALLAGLGTGLGVELGTGLGLAACSPAWAQTRSPSGLLLRTGDYATDRSAFRTRLVVRGPAPQPHGMPSAPRGAREIDYPSGDLRLRAWIGLPARAPERAPVVLFLHGGFAFSEEDYEMARPFLDAGYAVVMPSVRGENGQAGAFSMFFDEVGDVLAVTDYVRSQSWADPQRIYVAGHSAGGTLTMLAALASPHYRAVAPFSGSPDQLLLAKGLPRIVPFDRKIPAEYEIRSPLCYATSFKTPARLLMGRQEEFYRTSTRLLATLARNAGKDVAAVEVAGDHFNAVPEEISQAIAFFRANA